MKITKRHITIAIVFVAAFFGPLCLIPVFPEVQPIQILGKSTAAFLGLWLAAVVIAIIVDRVLFGKPKEHRQE